MLSQPDPPGRAPRIDFPQLANVLAMVFMGIVICALVGSILLLLSSTLLQLDLPESALLAGSIFMLLTLWIYALLKQRLFPVRKSLRSDALYISALFGTLLLNLAAFFLSSSFSTLAQLIVACCFMLALLTLCTSLFAYIFGRKPRSSVTSSKRASKERRRNMRANKSSDIPEASPHDPSTSHTAPSETPMPVPEQSVLSEALPLGQRRPLPAYLLFRDNPLYQKPSPRKARFFTLPKPGEHPLTNQDAAAINEAEDLFALCDGATNNSPNSRAWAALLAHWWLQKPLSEQEIDGGRDYIEQWLATPRQQWADWVQKVWAPAVDRQRQMGGSNPLEWEEVEKRLETGASSTFLGLQIYHDRPLWRVLTFGDTCLFHIRKRDQTWEILYQVPALASGGFNDRPFLLKSLTGSRFDPPQYIEGKYKADDKLLLTTDALAEWIIRQNEKRLSDWIGLFEEDRDTEDFFYRINQMRERESIRPDDTTVIIIDLV